jgi:predicted restriction endonuclease
MLLAEIRRDHVSQPEELVGDFQPLQVDERALILARTVQRVGQGTFRARLLDAYDHRCAITGEGTEPVLDAAHIQPYLGPRSNHVRNGLRTRATSRPRPSLASARRSIAVKPSANYCPVR